MVQDTEMIAWCVFHFSEYQTDCVWKKIQSFVDVFSTNVFVILAVVKIRRTCCRFEGLSKSPPLCKGITIDDFKKQVFFIYSFLLKSVIDRKY